MAKLNSDKLALRLSLGITAMMAAILLVGQADIKLWLYPPLAVLNCHYLYLFLRPISDVITGKDYIRCYLRSGELIKSYKRNPVRYAVGLVSNVLPLCCYICFITPFVDWLVNTSS